MPNENGIADSFDVWRARFETQVNSRLARHEEVMRHHEEEIGAQTKVIGHVATQLDGQVIPMQRELSGKVESVERQIDEQGVTVDHLVNTMDSIVIPTQQQHAAKIAEHSDGNREAHDYIMSQRGAWALIQKGGIVIAAMSGMIAVIMQLLHYKAGR